MALHLVWQRRCRVHWHNIFISLHFKFRSTANHLTAIRVKMKMLQQILPLSPAWVVDAHSSLHLPFLMHSLSRSLSLTHSLSPKMFGCWIRNDERPSSASDSKAFGVYDVCYFHYDCSIFITYGWCLHLFARSLRITCLND